MRPVIDSTHLDTVTLAYGYPLNPVDVGLEAPTSSWWLEEYLLDHATS